MHTALKIAPVYHAPVVHLKDASQNAGVAARLLNPQAKAELVNELETEYRALRERVVCCVVKPSHWKRPRRTG